MLYEVITGELPRTFFGHRRGERLGGCHLSPSPRGGLLPLFAQAVPGTAVRAASEPFSAFISALATNKDSLFFFHWLHICKIMRMVCIDIQLVG